MKQFLIQARSNAKISRPIFVAIIILALSSPALAGTLHVPGEFATISEAIQAAVDGDVVLIADGVYTGSKNRDLNFQGKDIIVRSENGPAFCIIDCENQGRAFIFENDETRDARVEGLTMTHGSAPQGNGGGIDISLESRPTIRNCRFVDNFAVALGGGVAVRGASHVTIDHCEFIGNTAFGEAEGAQGGGISCFFATGTIVRECVFVNNYSEWGGAVDCSGSNTTMVNCLMIDNEAMMGGGAVFVSVSKPTLVNCTMSRNHAGAGGAIVIAGLVLPSVVKLQNCVLWDDGPDEIEAFIGRVDATYCNIAGGWRGEGNINANPRFEDPSRDSFRLDVGSPCIDAGDNSAVPSKMARDLDDLHRKVDDPDTIDTGHGTPPIVDMGAYEFQIGSPTLMIDPDPLRSGENGLFLASNLTPNAPSVLAYSVNGVGRTFVPRLNVTLDLRRPRQAGAAKPADGEGNVVWTLPIPPRASGVHAWFQVAQYANTTSVVDSVIQ